jgi:hypothetical protein
VPIERYFVVPNSACEGMLKWLLSPADYFTANGTIGFNRFLFGLAKKSTRPSLPQMKYTFFITTARIYETYEKTYFEQIDPPLRLTTMSGEFSFGFSSSKGYTAQFNDSASYYSSSSLACINDNDTFIVSGVMKNESDPNDQRLFTFRYQKYIVY